MKRRTLLPLVVLIAMVGAACAPPDDDVAVDEPEDPVEAPEDPAEEPEEPAEPVEISGDIVMARANWDTGYFQAEVYYQLLTELGYDVVHPEENELGAELFYTAANQRDVDFWANGWFPLHDPFLDEAPSAVRVGAQIPAGGFQGYLVDKASADELGITSIEQIAEDPALQEHFDFEGDGRADLVGCNAGWGCFEAIEAHFEEQGFGDVINHISAEYSVLMADAIARFERGEPIFYYTWTPNWTVGALVPGEDVVWIEAPTHPNGEDPVPGVEGCVSDPCDICWTANDINAVANEDFLGENPPAAALLEVIELPLVDVSTQNLWMDEGENTQADITRHAEEWIADNRDLVDQWLEAARAAA